MKINSLKSSLNEHNNPSTEGANNVNYEITKRLIDKYKPKALYDIEKMRTSKSQERKA